jgi:CRISPR-associated protein Csb2
LQKCVTSLEAFDPQKARKRAPAVLDLEAAARTWESHTDYRPARHAGRDKDPAAPLLCDIVAECERRGLPKPEVELLDLSVGPRDGVAARLRLQFAVAVAGPVLLGRDSHKGGGLFEAVMP